MCVCMPSLVRRTDSEKITHNTMICADKKPPIGTPLGPCRNKIFSRQN